MGAGTTLYGHDCKSFYVQCGEKQTGREPVWGGGDFFFLHLKTDKVE